MQLVFVSTCCEYPSTKQPLSPIKYATVHHCSISRSITISQSYKVLSERGAIEFHFDYIAHMSPLEYH